MSTNKTVILPTVGTGSRLGNLTECLNKALIPYKGRALISHILDNFPKEWRVIIPVGYKSEQVIEYCKMVHSDRNIQFVFIDDWESAISGTAYTLRQCQQYINEPFWYVPCDTYFNEKVSDDLHSDTYFVQPVSTDKSHLYTMFKIVAGVITDVTFKQPTTDEWSAFTGLTFIKEWDLFFNKLAVSKTREFINIISYGQTRMLETWLDFGDLTTYQTAIKKSQKFDFSKTDEITYIDNKKVIKWWLSSDVAKKKYERSLQNLAAFPDNITHTSNWLCYDYFEGSTVYQNNSEIIVSNLLNWLKEKVWVKREENIDENCSVFYKEKTLQRIQSFLKKHSTLPQVKSVNGLGIRSYSDYLDRIDWDLLTSDCRPYFIHGDLQFDNIVASPSGEFRLIDWRQEFAGNISAGDIYYDFAKMLGGCLIDYSKIKENEFQFSIVDGDAIIKVPQVENAQKYIQQIYQAAEDLELDLNKIRILVPIIFWNMSPLHAPPFDLLLWYYAMFLFENYDIVFGKL